MLPSPFLNPATVHVAVSVLRTFALMGGMDPPDVKKPSVEDWVHAFQKFSGLYADGDAKSCTTDAWYRVCAEVEDAVDTTPLIETPTPTYEVVSVKACPKWTGKVDGLGSWRMRNDMAERFERFVLGIHTLGGCVGSAGGMRRLNAQVTANRSRTSMHYPGLAADLATNMGMRKPKNKKMPPFVCVSDGKRTFTVLARITSSEPTSKMANVLGVTKKDIAVVENPVGVIYRRGKGPIDYKKFTGRYLNVTKVLKALGFDRIPARSSFFAGKSYGAAEWWHFSYTDPLVVGKSTFGGELLKIYSQEKVEASPLEPYIDYVFDGSKWVPSTSMV